MSETSFNFCMPVELHKGNEDEWRIRGVASTEAKDLQGEIVKQDGLDISPLKQGLGLFNYDHEKGPENILGAIDGADLTDSGLQVEGYLFKHQPRAKAFHDIMRSLKPEQKHRVKMSIEGKIIKRDGENGKTIARAKVDKVALTVDPVNPETYTELVKSISKVDEQPQAIIESKPITLKEELESVILKRGFKKALCAGTGNAGAPADMSGGSALMTESLDSDLKDLKDLDDDKKKAVKKIAKALSEKFPTLSGYQILKSICDKLKEVQTKGE